MNRVSELQQRLEASMSNITSSAGRIAETFNRHPLTGRSFAEQYHSVESISAELGGESKILLEECKQYREVIDDYDKALWEILSFYDMATATDLDTSAFNLGGIEAGLKNLSMLGESSSQMAARFKPRWVLLLMGTRRLAGA